jgi:hypothetical protein
MVALRDLPPLVVATATDRLVHAPAAKRRMLRLFVGAAPMWTRRQSAGAGIIGVMLPVSCFSHGTIIQRLYGLGRPKTQIKLTGFNGLVWVTQV